MSVWEKKRYRLVSNWIPYWSPLIFFFLLRIYKEKMVRRLIPRNIWSIQLHGFNLVHLNIVAICVFFLFWLANFQNPKNATTKNKWLSDTFEFWEAINFPTTKYGAWVQMLKKHETEKLNVIIFISVMCVALYVNTLTGLINNTNKNL